MITKKMDVWLAPFSWLAEAFYKEIPKELKTRAHALLDEGLVVTIKQFREKFGIKT